MRDMELVSLTVLAMTIVGMEREISQLRSPSGQKGHLFTLLQNQAVVLPVIALVLVKVLTMPSDMSLGLLLAAAAFATVYCVTEVPLSLGFTGVYRPWIDTNRMALEGQQTK